MKTLLIVTLIIFHTNTVKTVEFESRKITGLITTEKIYDLKREMALCQSAMNVIKEADASKIAANKLTAVCVVTKE